MKHALAAFALVAATAAHAEPAAIVHADGVAWLCDTMANRNKHCVDLARAKVEPAAPYVRVTAPARVMAPNGEAVERETAAFEVLCRDGAPVRFAMVDAKGTLTGTMLIQSPREGGTHEAMCKAAKP